MKYVTSLLLAANAWAAPIRIFYEEAAEVVAFKELMVRDYHIPEDLIGLRSVKECETLVEKGRLDLCLKNNGDLIVVSVERGFVNESLKIFRAP